MATKPQRLRVASTGFIGGLVALGFRGPWIWPHHLWDYPFVVAWRDWPPAAADSQHKVFPWFDSFDTGRKTRPREIEWDLDTRTHPFYIPPGERHTTPFTDRPRGLDPREFLKVWVDVATPDEWVALAERFTQEMRKLGYLSDDLTPLHPRHDR